MENTLEIVFASDDNYAQHLGVSLLSMFESNESFFKINAYVLDSGISLINKENLINISKKFVGRNIIFVEINAKLEGFKSKFQIPSTIAISAYSRLFLTEILDSSIDRLVYADSDSIFLDSLKGLWETDLSSFMIAGMEDIVDVKFKKEIDLQSDERYINSGLLLINLKKWREKAVFNKFIAVILKHGGSVPHHDQGVINEVFKEDKLILPPKYNVVTTFYEFSNVDKLKKYFSMANYYSQEEFDDAKNNPVFVHFTPSYSKRPWFLNSRHPLKNQYFKFLEKTPWSDYQLKKDNRKSKILLLEKLFWIFGPKLTKQILKFRK